MSDFSVRLSAARKACGMTQEQLAQQLHVSRQTVSHWENGRALPDVDMAKRVADVLNMHEPVPHMPVLDAASGLQSHHHRRLLAVCVVLVLLGLAGGLLLSGVLPAAQAQRQAVITVTPEVEEAVLLVNDVFPQGGWDVGFNIANVSDVPFRPRCLVARYYAGEELVNAISVPYEQLLPWMASDMLRQGEAPLRWPFGTNYLYLTHMECIIYGTDANGNELSFSGSVRYLLPEGAEAENSSY